MTFLTRIEQLEREKRDLIVGIKDARASLLNLRPGDDSPSDRQFQKAVGRITEILTRHEPNQTQSHRP